MAEQNTKYNNGDFWSGLGYLGQKAFGGLVGSLEGIVDYVSGGIAQIFGNQEFAENVMSNNWINYNAPDEWFNPDQYWKFAGDIAAGVGNSLPSLGVGLLTGGLGFLPSIGASFGLTFLSSGGNAVKDAYNETGNLGGAEWGFGSLSGLAEGIVESAGTFFGLGKGALLKAFGKGIKGSAAVGLGKTLLSGFTGEALEEAVSAAISPFLKKFTYDKNAQNATAGDVLYSALVGGLSGMIVNGAGYGVGSAVDAISGNEISTNEKRLNEVISSSKNISEMLSSQKTETPKINLTPETKTENDTSDSPIIIGQNSTETLNSDANGLNDNEVLKDIKKSLTELEESLKTTDGKVKTVKQKQLVGYLNRRLGEAAFQPQFMNSLAGLVKDPQATVDSINSYYGTDKITVEDLTQGLESTDVSSREFKKSAYKALKENDTLRNLVVMQTVGRLELNAQRYADSIFGDTPISTVATQENLNRFVENNDTEVVSAVSEALGIDLTTASSEEFATAIRKARDNGAIEQYREGVEAIRAAKASESPLKVFPKNVITQKNGVTRYTSGGKEYAIIRDGRNYRLYDYSSGDVTKAMTAVETNKLMREIEKSSYEGNNTPGAAQVEADSKKDTEHRQKRSLKERNKEIEELCREKIPEYGDLSTSERSSIRMTVRQALSNGFGEKDAALFGRIAAKSGMNIYVKDDIPGEDAFYDGKNSIYINASSKKENIHRGILGHEMFHKLFASRKGANDLYKDALKNVDSETKKEVLARYKEKCEELGIDKKTMERISSEEAAAAYSEQILGIEGVWEFLLTEKPSLKDRVLNFFKKKSKDFFKDLIGEEADKWLRKYKKHFDAMSDANKGQNAFDNSTERNDGEKDALLHPETETEINKGSNVILKNIFGTSTEKTSKTENPENDVEKDKSVLNSETENNVISTEVQENGNENQEGIRIRNGGKRYGSQNPEEQILGVEESPGQAESRRKGSGIKDSAAARLINEGRKIKVSELGIPGGSENHSVVLVDRSSETKMMNIARRSAEARGVQVGFFVGNNLALRDSDGKIISARGYISSDGKKVLIRGDHPLYSSKQIMRHELGHDMIAKGEIDPDDVRERLEKTVGKENIDKVAELYAEAYAGTGMTAEEIFEEFVCDSLGDMNIFAGEDAKALLDKVIPEAKKAASESKEPSKTRGPPEGKASVDDKNEKASKELDTEVKAPADGMAAKNRQKLKDLFGDGEGLGTPTISTVAKDKPLYKEGFKGTVKKTADSIYIHTVDEMWGIQNYIEKYGKNKDAKALIQAARAVPNQAQSMIGSVQYNVFAKGKAKEKLLGDGIAKIFKPVKAKGEAYTESFNDYLFHHLNVDKYKAFEAVRESQESDLDALKKTQEQIEWLESRNLVLKRDIQKLGNSKEDMTRKQRYKETVESNTEKLKKLKADENFLLSVTTAFAGSELESTQKSIKKLNEDIENHEREIYNLGNTKKDIERKDKLIDTIAAKKRKIEILEKRKQSYEENLTLYNYALKPVFGINGETVTREESESYISKYEAMHPEFKDIAKKVWNYSQNINAMRSSAGLISHSMMERMKTLYPHYVPAWRAEIGNGGKSDKGIKVESTVKKAKGYNHNLVHVDVALATQTKQALKNGSINVLANEIYDSSVKSGDVKYVDVGFDPDVGAKKISAGMTDNERYLILKDKELSLSATVDIKKVASAQVELKISDEDIEFSKYGDKKRLFKKLGEEFSVFHGYKNDDIKLEFKFSKGNIAESVSKQGKNYTDFAKMLSCFDEVVENAIGIEVHNRNKEGYKKDDTLKNVYVLTSAFTDGKKIVPVKLEVKEFSDKENTLHVAIALESIEKDGIVKQEVAKDGVARQYSPPSGISIAEFLGKINPKDESFYKYIPKQFTEAAESERKDGEGRSKPHKITFFRNGKEYSMDVSDEIYLGFKGITEATVPPSNVISKAMGKVNKLFKSVVTSLSPAFTIRNAVRDIQDAGFNTKHGKGFAKNIPIAWKEIITNSERWKLYRAHGGFASTVFDSKGFEGAIGDRGFEEIKLYERFANGQKLSKKELAKNALYLKDLLTGIENVNAVVEQIPRFAEFLASLEAGEDVQTAIYNSAEVTTNFGRRGAMAKHLNATVIPFLNPAIQGFDKIFRNVNDAVSGKGSAKAVVGGVLGLFTKAFIIGMVPMIFNSLLYSDDEDYENLREEDKENNYLFKLASGRFFRLPRGRVASVVSGFTNRVGRTISGKDSDWGGYFENVVSQITPVGNVTRNFFSPISDVNTNTTWYGTAIEGREYENVRPSQRYDESTSDIAIALGKAFNYSPKKIHYLLDQYLGVVGDFILPATTKQAEKDYILDNFTIDSVTSNKLSTRFYELYDEAKYAKKEGDTAAIYQVKYFDEAGTAVSYLYDEIEKIQKSDKSDEDKLNEVRTLRALINAVLKSSIDGYSAFTNAISETEHLGYDDSKTSGRTKRYNKIRKLAFGIDSGMYDEIKETYGPQKEEKKSSSPYAGLFTSKKAGKTSSGSSSGPYSALFSPNKKTSGAKSGKKISYYDLLGVK